MTLRRMLVLCAMAPLLMAVGCDKPPEKTKSEGKVDIKIRKTDKGTDVDVDVKPADKSP